MPTLNDQIAICVAKNILNTDPNTKHFYILLEKLNIEFEPLGIVADSIFIHDLLNFFSTYCKEINNHKTDIKDFLENIVKGDYKSTIHPTTTYKLNFIILVDHLLENRKKLLSLQERISTLEKNINIVKDLTSLITKYDFFFHGVCTHIFKFTDNYDQIDKLIYVPNKKLIVGCYSGSNWINIWNDKAEFETSLQGHNFGITALALLPDSEKLISGEGNGNIKIWNLDNYTCELTLKSHIGNIIKILIIPSLSIGEPYLIVSASLGLINIWEPKNGKLYRNIITHNIKFLEILPSGKLSSLITVEHDSSIIRIWDIETEKCIKELNFSSNINCLSVIPSERKIVSGHCGGCFVIWNPDESFIIVNTGMNAPCIIDFLYYQNGYDIITVLTNRVIAIWDPQDFKTVKMSTVTRHSLEITSLKVLNNGYFATSSKDKTIRIWEPENPIHIHVLKGHTSDVKDLLVLPDGLVSGSRDGQIRIWK